MRKILGIGYSLPMNTTTVVNRGKWGNSLGIGAVYQALWIIVRWLGSLLDSGDVC